MKRTLPVLLAGLLVLSACQDSSDQAAESPASPPTAGESATEREGREAMDAIGEAGRATGDAARAAAEDLRDAAGPALERAREQGAQALEAAQDGLNDLTRGAACQTARAADDAEGIAANC